MSPLFLETSPNTYRKLNSVALQASLSELTTMIANLSEAESGTLRLDEVNINIKISPQGDIILHNGNNTKQAIELKFKRHSSSATIYQKLATLLAQGQWQKANQETWDLLCKAIGKAINTKLSPQDIQKIPCTTLSSIDQLWQKHSNGKFGFTIQSRIYKQHQNP